MDYGMNTKNNKSILEMALDIQKECGWVSEEKVKEMAILSCDAIKFSLEVLNFYDEEKANKVIKMEDTADRYEDVIGSYLVKLSSKNISTADSQSMSIILHSISDFERISDHAMDIVKSAQELNLKGLSFTDNAKSEINTLCRAVMDICELTTECFCEGDDKKAMHVEPLEEVIDALSKKLFEAGIKTCADIYQLDLWGWRTKFEGTEEIFNDWFFTTIRTDVDTAYSFPEVISAINFVTYYPYGSTQRYTLNIAMISPKK